MSRSLLEGQKSKSEGKLDYVSQLLLALFCLQLSLGAMSTELCSEVVISAHPKYPPFHWQQGQTLTGASIDVSVAIFNSLGVKSRVSFVGPWKRVLHQAENGHIDFIPALKNVKERHSYLSFTNTPFYSNPVAIFMRAEEDRKVQSLADLEGLVGSINLGDRHGKLIDVFVDSQPKMQRIRKLSSSFQMLSLGRTDYFIEGLYTGRDFLHNNPLNEAIKVAKVFHDNLVHNGFSLKSNCLHLMREYDQRLKQLSDSGYVAQKMEEYERIWLDRAKSDE